MENPGWPNFIGDHGHRSYFHLTLLHGFGFWLNNNEVLIRVKQEQFRKPGTVFVLYVTFDPESHGVIKTETFFHP